MYCSKKMGACLSSNSNKRSNNQSLPPKVTKYIKFIDNNGSLTDSYTMVKKIGEGATSNVKLITCKHTTIQRAVKSIMISNEKLRIKAEREIEILKKVDHPCMLRSIESYKEANTVHIISEYYTGPSLYDMLKEGQGLSEKVAIKYMHYIISGLSYLHNLGIMHRDIKPENLVFESSDPEALLKIIDFGSAQYLNKKLYKKKCGTILYMSPQVLECKYTEKCDIWSAGIIFYIMLSGSHPFYSDTEQDLLDKIRHLPLQFKSPKWASVSLETKQLISSMLAKKEIERPSLNEIRKKLNFSVEVSERKIKKTYSQIINYRSLSELHRCIVNVGLIKIIHSERAGTIFLHLDADGDGIVKIQDFLCNNPEKLKESSKMFREFENDHLTFNEFMIAFCDWGEVLGRDVIRAIFQLMDKDKDENLTFKDLEKYCARPMILANEICKGEKLEDCLIKYEDFESLLHSS